MKPFISALRAQWIAVIALVIAIGAFYQVTHKHTAAPEGQKIAFVDFQTVMKDSSVGKSISHQLDPKQKAMQEQAEAKLKSLKEQQAAIQKGKATPAEMAAKNAALQKEINDWNVTVQAKEAALNKAAAPALEQVQVALREQVEAIAAENGYTAILPMQSALFVNKTTDITSEVIRRLDKRVSSIDIKFEE